MSYSLRDSDYWGQRGYERAFGDRDEYMDGYQQGYQAGYDEAFYGLTGQYGELYGRPQAGDRVAALDDVYAGRPYSSTDMAFDAGYREGITLGQQDRARNTRSSGEIRFTDAAADRASVAGSLAHKFVSGAPLPSALAGALIGRIDNGLPFGIGDQTTITVPASGLLYLGTNHDNVRDNSGQFQVIISSGR